MTSAETACSYWRAYIAARCKRLEGCQRTRPLGGGNMNKHGILVLSLFVFLASFSSGQDRTRVEKDLLGEKQIPAAAYYGVQTARALENFQISGIQINHYPGFVEAWAMVKLTSRHGVRQRDGGQGEKSQTACCVSAAGGVSSPQR